MDRYSHAKQYIAELGTYTIVQQSIGMILSFVFMCKNIPTTICCISKKYQSYAIYHILKNMTYEMKFDSNEPIASRHDQNFLSI